MNGIKQQDGLFLSASFWTPNKHCWARNECSWDYLKRDGRKVTLETLSFIHEFWRTCQTLIHQAGWLPMPTSWKGPEDHALLSLPFSSFWSPQLFMHFMCRTQPLYMVPAGQDVTSPMKTTCWMKRILQASQGISVRRKKKAKSNTTIFSPFFFFFFFNSTPKNLKQMLKSKIMVPPTLFKWIASNLALVRLHRGKVRTTLKYLAQHGLHGRHLCSPPSFSMCCIADLLFCL